MVNDLREQLILAHFQVKALDDKLEKAELKCAELNLRLEEQTQIAKEQSDTVAVLCKQLETWRSEAKRLFQEHAFNATIASNAVRLFKSFDVYSDLRKPALKILCEGVTQCVAARFFSVSTSTVSRAVNYGYTRILSRRWRVISRACWSFFL